jgi:hypothetical protein
LPPIGQYDVLAWQAPALLYIEPRVARPSDITGSDICFFLQRSEELAPELAILMIDTADDVQPLVDRMNNVMFPAIERASREKLERYEVLTRFPMGVFFGHRRTYVINTEQSIETQIRRCLRHYHARVKGVLFEAPPRPVNFLPR